MAGWLLSQLENRKALTLQDAAQTVQVKLPRFANIGALHGIVRATHATSIKTAIDRIRVVGNGAMLWDTTGGEAHALAKYETGHEPKWEAAGASNERHFFIPFGRGRRDEAMMLPKGFRTLQLELDLDPNATPTALDLSLSAELFLGAAPPWMRRIYKAQTEASSANKVIRFDVPTQNHLRALYLHVDDDDNILGNPMRFIINDGTEVPIIVRADQLEEWCKLSSRFLDETIPFCDGDAMTAEKLLKIDFDMLEDLSRMLHAGAINRLQLEVTCAGSGTSGDVELLAEEVLAVPKPKSG